MMMAKYPMRTIQSIGCRMDIGVLSRIVIAKEIYFRDQLLTEEGYSFLVCHDTSIFGETQLEQTARNLNRAMQICRFSGILFT